MVGIRKKPAIAIPHRRKIAFENGTDPDSERFPRIERMPNHSPDRQQENRVLERSRNHWHGKTPEIECPLRGDDLMEIVRHLPNSDSFVNGIQSPNFTPAHRRA
jgi:hypothetical protein